MKRTFMLGKIHRAKVTRADPDYVGSVSVDADFLKAAGMLPHEKVLLVNLDTGARMETYVLEAPSGSKVIGMNGGSAHLLSKGDLCLIMTFVELEPGERAVSRTAIIGEGNSIEAVIEADIFVPDDTGHGTELDPDTDKVRTN